VAANPKPLRQRCGIAGIGQMQQRLKSRFILRRDTICGPPPTLVAELGRAKRRAELEAKIDTASAELAKFQPARVANSDAKALQRYLLAVGVDIAPERLNDLLVLLSVLMIEVGGSLALAVGMALSSQPGRPEPATAGYAPPPASPTQPNPATTVPATAAIPAPAVQLARAAMPGMAETDIEAFLRASGGVAEGFRRLAGTLGRPRSTVGDECHGLAAAGRLVLGRGRRGMTIALADAGRLN
jgi:hypothetical protein